MASALCLPSFVPLLHQSVRLLPDPSVVSGWAQFRFGVGAGGAPDGVAASLHDGTGAGAHRAHVRGRPVALQQPVQPATQRRPRQAGVGLGLLHGAQAHRQPQHRVEAVEALLHVGVPGRAGVQPQSVLWIRAREDNTRSKLKSEEEELETFSPVIWQQFH